MRRRFISLFGFFWQNKKSRKIGEVERKEGKGDDRNKRRNAGDGETQRLIDPL